MELKDGRAVGCSTYTPALIRTLVESDLERLLVPWMLGRQSNYTMSQATKLTVATEYWIREQLEPICNAVDLKTQVMKFHRETRTHDIFEIASECINEALQGSVEQNRKPHRKWG